MIKKAFLSPRESGHVVAKHSKHIKICDDGIESCAKEVVNRIQSGKIKLVNDDPKKGEGTFNFLKKDIVHPQVADQHGVDWVFFMDALNFSFWNFSTGAHKQYLVTYKGVTYTGYLAFLAATCRTLDSGVPLTTPSFYRNVTKQDLSSYLLGDDGVECPLIEERVACLHQISSVLEQKFGNTFVNCIKFCESTPANKAQNLLNLVYNEFPCFRDEAEYIPEVEKPPMKVAFMKRAQILIADLWSLFENKGLGQFDDIGSLTMFADYRVPQSLQYFGAFKYSDALLNELNKSEVVMENGSEFEIEIRGCSIEAVDRIVKRVKQLLQEAKEEQMSNYVNDVAIDYFLWGFRREKADEMIKFPYHKVRSIYY